MVVLSFVEEELSAWKNNSWQGLRLGVRVQKPELMDLGDPGGRKFGVRR